MNKNKKIQDKWSTKVEKRNATIRALTDEKKNLKEQVTSLSVSPPSPKELPAQSETQPVTAALQKEIKKLNARLDHGVARFQTVKGERTTLAEENTNLAAQLAEKEKVILYLRSSEEAEKHRLRMLSVWLVSRRMPRLLPSDRECEVERPRG